MLTYDTLSVIDAEPSKRFALNTHRGGKNSIRAIFIVRDAKKNADRLAADVEPTPLPPETPGHYSITNSTLYDTQQATGLPL